MGNSRRQSHASTPNLSVQRWKTIVTAINKDPYARGRVIFDILNEPDAYGLRWEVSKNPHVPSITTNYLRFMDMASKINHSALLAVNTDDADRECWISVTMCRLISSQRDIPGLLFTQLRAVQAVPPCHDCTCSVTMLSTMTSAAVFWVVFDLSKILLVWPTLINFREF